MKNRAPLVLTLLVCAALASGLSAAAADDDIVAARKVMEHNLHAFQSRDLQSYLGDLLHDPSFVSNGPAGSVHGFDAFSKSIASQPLPDNVQVSNVRYSNVSPGVVLASYDYRVRFGSHEYAGISQRLLVKRREGWKIASATSIDSTPTPAPLAIVGATLVDADHPQPIRNSVVLVRDGRIECAGTREQCAYAAPDYEVIDASSMWLVPGLVDAHVHFSQTGWADGRPDAFDVRQEFPYERVESELKHDPQRFFRTDLCSGVTAVFDVGGYPWTFELPRMAEDDTLAPHVSVAGPLLSTLDHWLNLPAERQFVHLKDAATAESGVRYLASHGAQAVKVWYIVGKDLPVEASAPAVMAAGEQARKAGLPLIVHATGLAEAKQALRAGAKMLVHSVSDLPVDDEFISLAKQNDVVYVPTLTVSRGYVDMFNSIVSHREPAIDDPLHCVDPVTRSKVLASAKQDSSKLDAARVTARAQRVTEQERVSAENLRRVMKAGILVAMGTDAGNPLTLHGASVFKEMEAMQSAGMTPFEVLVSATRGGSVAMRRSGDYGTIAKGKMADLLLLGADPLATTANLRKVRFVIRGGVMRSATDLSAIAAGMTAVQR